MKKSSLLIALPCLVITEIRPDPAPDGTVVAIEVVVAEVTVVRAMLRRVSFLMRLVLKFVPVTVTDVPGGPTLGVNPVIVGTPEEPTVNTEPLAADPAGEVTPISPVVAPAGTVVTIRLAVEEIIVAVVPLKVTVFWLGVALKPVP